MSDKTMAKRQTNMEALRVLAAFMVLTLHCLGVEIGKVLPCYPFGSFGYVLFWTIESLSYVAVNIFVMISGYFMARSAVTAQRTVKRIARLWVQVETYCIFGIFISIALCKNTPGMKDLLLCLVPFTGEVYWYVSCYAMLLVLSPVLNILILAMDQKQHRNVILLLTIIFSIVPSFLFWGRGVTSSGYGFTWFAVLYIAAAYIGRYEEQDDFLKKKAGFYVGAYFALGGGMGIISRLLVGAVVLTVTGSTHGAGVFYTYNSVLFFPASVCLFLAFTKIQINNVRVQKGFALLGSVSFGSYLLTEHPMVRTPLWDWINMPRYCSFGVLTALCAYVAVIAALFCVGCSFEWCRKQFMKWSGLQRAVDIAIEHLIPEKAGDA